MKIILLIGILLMVPFISSVVEIGTVQENINAVIINPVEEGVVGNPFNQTLNIEDDVIFNNVTITGFFNGLFNWTSISNFLSFDGSNLDFNTTSFNDTYDERYINTNEGLVKEFRAIVTTVSGQATHTTNISFNSTINSFIINATTASTTFRFEALENTSLNKLDSDREIHTGNWHIVKNVAAFNNNITMRIINSSVDENFILSFRYT